MITIRVKATCVGWHSHTGAISGKRDPLATETRLKGAKVRKAFEATQLIFRGTLKRSNVRLSRGRRTESSFL